MTSLKRAKSRVLFLLPAALLLVALLPLPYGYYTFLRIVVCLSAAIAAFYAFRANTRLDAFVVTSVAVAIVFNPIIPVYLNKGLWSVIDVVAAIWFAVLAYLGSKRTLSSSMDR